MRPPSLIENLSTKRSLVRPIILAACTGVVLLGLPRLAGLFREPPDGGAVNILSDAPGKRLDEVNQASHSLAAPKEPVVHAGPVAPSSLRAAKPDINKGVVRKGATMNLQAAQDLINGRIPRVIVTPPEEGIPSDGYLPPWNALRARELAQGLAPAASRGAALTVRIAAESNRVESRRHKRISTKYSYARARHRSRFLFTPDRGYFQY